MGHKCRTGLELGLEREKLHGAKHWTLPASTPPSGNLASVLRKDLILSRVGKV